MILVRTGTGALWEDREAFLAAGGSTRAVALVRRSGPLAVGADNMAWDVPGAEDPELGSLPGHLLLLVRAGIYIVEASTSRSSRATASRVRLRLPAAEAARRHRARRYARSRSCRPRAMAQTHYFPTDQVHYTWDTGHEPVITIADGDTVVIETREVSDNQVNPDSDASVIAGMDWDRVYPLAGPIRVEGAAPGDTLAVEILDLRTRGWGWTAIFPASACCPTTSPTPT